MANIAFIGLGNMGGPMAANLLKAKHTVSVFDLVPEAVKTLTDQGARAADSAADACRNAEFVITMLPAGKHVKGLYLDQGLLDALDKSAVVMDCSTIDADTARLVAGAAREKGIGMMDTPVSGGVAAAQAGTLTFMCGGDQQTYEQGRPILEAMGKATFLAGDHGSGQIAKMCNNMLLSICMIGTSEALQLGADNGLDPAALSEIMLASSGRNWCLELYNPCPGVMEKAPASNDYKPGFMVDLMMKDLGLAQEAAVASGTATPLGGIARNLYTAHARAGNGKLDFSSIYRILEKK